MSTNTETAGAAPKVTQRRRVVDDGRAVREFGWRPEVPIARWLTRRWFRARGLVLGRPLAAACARGPVVVEEVPEPVVCRHGPECNAKWRRAREWVEMHCRWPIREDTDALIATDGPDDTRDPAFVIRRVASGTSAATDVIVFGAGCTGRVRFGALAEALMRIRLGTIVVLGGILALLSSPPGRRHPRPVAVLAPLTIGAMQNAMALATGGATSPINANTSFAILGMAFLMTWPPLWSAFTALVIVTGFVGGQAVALGTAGRVQFLDNLLLFSVVGALAVVTTAVRERARWREFQQRWALAEAGREVAAS